MSVQLGQGQTRGGVAMPFAVFSAALSLFSLLVHNNVQHAQRRKP
jgi:hypothetical protein